MFTFLTVTFIIPAFKVWRDKRRARLLLAGGGEKLD